MKTRLITVLFAFALSSIAANAQSYFGALPATTNLHELTNAFLAVKGEGTNAAIRRVPPRDALRILKGLSEWDALPSSGGTATGLTLSGGASATGNLSVTGGDLSTDQALTVTGTADIGGSATVGGNLRADGELQIGNKRIKLTVGNGSPEGFVAANPQSIYLNTNQTAGIGLYLKTNGTGNTGWWLLVPGDTSNSQYGRAALTNVARFYTNTIFVLPGDDIASVISNAPSGSEIVLAAGTWNVTPSKVLSNGLGAINLFNKDNIRIKGIPNLSIISGRAAVGELIYATNVHNFELDGVTLDGLVVTNYTLLSGIGHVWGGLGVYNVSNMKIQNCQFLNHHDHGIYDLGSQPNWNTISTNRIEIIGNLFHNIGSQRTNEVSSFDGTAIVPTGWVIDGNTFTECLRCIEPYTENDSSPNLEYRDIIRNNQAYNTLEFFVGSAGSTNSHFVTIENNKMINDYSFTRRGTNIFNSSSAISWNGGYGWKAVNNEIKGRWGYGIIASSGVRDGLIAWNRIHDLTNDVGSAVPIQAGVTYRVNIIGNDIRRSENQAIYLFGFRDGECSYNFIDGTAAGIGIRLLTIGGTVTSNVLLRANNIRVATVGVQDLSGGLENISLVDNVIEEASTKYSNSSGATEWQQWTRDSSDTNRIVRAHEVRSQLAAGSNITLTPDANGVTTIDASSGGSGSTNPVVLAAGYIVNSNLTFQSITNLGTNAVKGWDLLSHRRARIGVFDSTSTIVLTNMPSVTNAAGGGFNVKYEADVFVHASVTSPTIASLHPVTFDGSYLLPGITNKMWLEWTGTNWQAGFSGFSRTGVRRTIWLDASYFGTNGAQPAIHGALVSASNAKTLNYLLFGDSANTNSDVGLVLPPEWDRGNITVQPHWTATNGSGAVVWQVAADYADNDDSIDGAFGSNVSVTDTLLATFDYHIAPATGAITFGNAPGAASGRLYLRVRRDPGNAGDTLGANAFLLGIAIQYTESTTEPTALP